jgi:predicted nucleotidyltransferase
MGQTTAPVRIKLPTLAERRKLRRTAVQTLVKRIISEIHPTCVILFGSVAKNTDKIDSDVDIVVVGGDLPSNIFDRIGQLQRLTRRLGVPFDIFPYTEAEFEKMLDNKHVTALDCMYEGIPLHGKAYFKRLHKRFDELVKQGWHRTKCTWTMHPEKP